MNYRQRMQEEQLRREEELLPEHYCTDDRQHLLRKISAIPEALRKEFSKKYSEIYIQTYNKEENEIKKSNKARAAANGWILSNFDKFSNQ